ncbi:Nuclear pore complex protein Nup93 [Blattella germanica]|nr:Nuclear pore complex protein Nup93 [Blattella germanica]
MVRYMSEVPPRATGDPIASRVMPQIQNVLIGQARKYLEDRYKTYMTNVVMGNLQQARRGGVPGTFPLVRSFVAVRIPPGLGGLEDGTVEDQPFWPLVYYCLQLVNSKEKKLSSRLETLVRFQYRRHIRNTTDPFKKAVYCVIGACDVNDEHPDVANAADDYLWLKLCQIRESHYNALEQPHVYFQVLILTGQFEAAIEFLARIEKLRVHAVHIAIALNEEHLLAVPSNVQAPLCKNMKGSEGGNLFMSCVSDLALESREFDLLLGFLEATGLRIPGLIDTFQGVQADTKLIIQQVAMDSERKGMFEDAIKLYDLAGNHEKVLSLMTAMLSQVVHQVTRPGSLRARLQELAESITARYRGQQISSSPETASTFFLLRDLLNFFDQFHAQEYPQALEQLSYLREKARAITSFAGTVPYRMPGDTNSRLVQMEILMH